MRIPVLLSLHTLTIGLRAQTNGTITVWTDRGEVLTQRVVVR